MAKGKSTGVVSKGGRTQAKKAQEAKRIARFAARKESGKAYTYTPNPYEKGSKEWRKENNKRKAKINVSAKTPYSKLVSIFATLDRELNLKKNEKKVLKSNTSKKNLQQA